MVQLEKALAPKADDLSLISELRVEGENWLLIVVLWSIC